MKTYALTFIKKDGITAIKVFQHELACQVQRERTRLKKDPKYRNGILQIRTLGGFEAKNIL